MTQLHGDIPANADERIGSFSVYRNAPLSAASGDVIGFDTEEWDISGWFAAAGTNRFTPQEAGHYRLSAHTALVTGTGALLVVGLYKNGAAYKWGQKRTGTGPTSSVSALVSLNGSTDYVTAVISHTRAGATALQVGAAETYFQGELAGRT